jgi:ATP-dependent DNA ligase
VASEVVPCVFLAAPHPQRHITPSATEEVKLDGYRAIGVRTSRDSILYSRNHKNFNKRFPQIAEAPPAPMVRTASRIEVTYSTRTSILFPPPCKGDSP